METPISIVRRLAIWCSVLIAGATGFTIHCLRTGNYRLAEVGVWFLVVTIFSGAMIMWRSSLRAWRGEPENEAREISMPVLFFSVLAFVLAHAADLAYGPHPKPTPDTQQRDRYKAKYGLE